MLMIVARDSMLSKLGLKTGTFYVSDYSTSPAAHRVRLISYSYLTVLILDVPSFWA